MPKADSDKLSLKLLEVLGEGVVAFHPIFARIANSTTAGLFLSQCLYWFRTNNMREFSRSQEEWQRRTSLTRYEQEGARKKLRQIGVLRERNAPLEHKLYYSLDVERLIKLLTGEDCIPECGKTTFGDAENPHPLECGNSASGSTLIEEKEKEDITRRPNSPQAGGAVSENHHTSTQFDFKMLWTIIPHRRTKDADRDEREARKAWDDPELSGDERQRICFAAQAWVDSGEWTREDGKYIPSAANFIKRRSYYWENPPTNHKAECQEVRDYFLEATGQLRSENGLWTERKRMLSERFDQALSMGYKRGNAVGLMKDAIDKHLASKSRRKPKDQVEMEDIFGTPEKFERLAKMEYAE